MPEPAVSVRDLRKSFGPLEVLRGVSLDAHLGEVIAILGASGSGKSTLLRCINMLEVPDSGEVLIGGERIALRRGRAGRMEPADVRRHNPGLEPGRVDVIVGGALVVVSIMRHWGFDEMLVSEADILDGLVRSIP